MYSFNGLQERSTEFLTNHHRRRISIARFRPGLSGKDTDTTPGIAFPIHIGSDDKEHPARIGSGQAFGGSLEHGAGSAKACFSERGRGGRNRPGAICNSLTRTCCFSTFHQIWR